MNIPDNIPDDTIVEDYHQIWENAPITSIVDILNRDAYPL